MWIATESLCKGQLITELKLKRYPYLGNGCPADNLFTGLLPMFDQEYVCMRGRGREGMSVWMNKHANMFEHIGVNVHMYECVGLHVQMCAFII